ncbi:unnamed protein product, partial [Staurois parvus]
NHLWAFYVLLNKPKTTKHFEKNFFFLSFCYKML